METQAIASDPQIRDPEHCQCRLFKVQTRYELDSRTASEPTGGRVPPWQEDGRPWSLSSFTLEMTPTAGKAGWWPRPGWRRSSPARGRERS